LLLFFFLSTSSGKAGVSRLAAAGVALEPEAVAAC